MNHYGILLVSRLDIKKNEICNRMRYQLWEKRYMMRKVSIEKFLYSSVTIMNRYDTCIYCVKEI